ncbi:MAG: alpha/beta hydrolase [Pseudoflavonifractor sp.]|nr:alpha/beta hydrolase [Alloprevotella sp.]MCM1116368.1 alpha/beta hydrolase [Pseudoflavonifractor sp.]
MRLFAILILIALSAASLHARYEWTPDTAALGNSFMTLTISPGSNDSDPFTIIRPADNPRSTRGILYIHGFNDYFFQAEMADSFVAHGYDFYAIDLQRYGRSIRPGQIHCDARHGLGEYFPAIDSALAVMRYDSIADITLMGHSTGGLIASFYMAKNPDAPVDNLILNSPFLAWNLGKLNRLIPLVCFIGGIFPGIMFSQGDSDTYASSVLASHHGRWSYRTDWKLIHSPDVSAGWIRSITKAQNYLKDHPRCISVPTLLLTSQNAYDGASWTPAADSADAVLNPPAIRKIGVTLPAEGCWNVIVPGGLHDLFLSSPSVTTPLYAYIFKWLALQQSESMLKKFE